MYGLGEALYPYTIEIFPQINIINGKEYLETSKCTAILGPNYPQEVVIGDGAQAPCFFFVKMPSNTSTQQQLWKLSFHMDSLDGSFEGEENDVFSLNFFRSMKYVGSPMAVNYLKRHGGNQWRVDLTNSTIIQ